MWDEIGSLYCESIWCFGRVSNLFLIKDSTG